MRQLIAVSVSAVVFSLAPAGPSRADILPPHAVVAGKTIGEWTADWWRWAGSFAAPNDPFTDPTGASANLRQGGPVFFVAGTTGGAAQRAFTVPTDVFLLIPLVNAEEDKLQDPTLTEAQIVQLVTSEADTFDSLHALIDGTAVPAAELFLHREATSGFQFEWAPDNAFGVPAGNSGFAAADGYWLMLTPLALGSHEIRFGGGSTALMFSVDVLDTITAIPEPSAFTLLALGTLGLLGYAWRRQRAG
jgi:hypothetical protein